MAKNRDISDDTAPLRWLTTVYGGSPDAFNNMITGAHCEGANNKCKIKTIIQHNLCLKWLKTSG